MRFIKTLIVLKDWRQCPYKMILWNLTKDLLNGLKIKMILPDAVLKFNLLDNASLNPQQSQPP